MAFVLVATVGDASANSYLTVQEATDLLQIRFADVWTAANSQDQELALAAATEDIDAEQLDGYRYSLTQALEFPRGIQDEPLDEIPQDVRLACAHQALWIVTNKAKGGQTQRQQLQAQGVVEYQIGHLREKFDRSAGSKSPLCPQARAFLQRWIVRSGHLIGRRQRSRFRGNSNWPQTWPPS